MCGHRLRVRGGRPAWPTGAGVGLRTCPKGRAGQAGVCDGLAGRHQVHRAGPALARHGTPGIRKREVGPGDFTHKGQQARL
eukprot:967831-Heterocapsa_arctica.AAC.1